MSKVFRLYNIQGANTIVDWQESKVYGTQAISEIEDPEGATAKKEITSIPSPFARIDLIKTAFREVNGMARQYENDAKMLKLALTGRVLPRAKNGNVEIENTIYHKMVAEMFDVAQLFFNYDRFKDKFEILVWDRTKDLDLENTLGHTLNLFLKSDAKGDDPYNFRKMKRFYMLNYIGPDRPSDMNIVGGTSPATLFFSSANNLSYVSKNVLFDNDRPFDEKCQPLFKRSFDFQKYLFALRKSNRDFTRDFSEVSKYMDLTYSCLSNEEKDEIYALADSSINGYEPIGVGDKGQDHLEILGHAFHKKPKETNWQSDFAIRSSVYNEPKMPLVLPVEKGNNYTDLIYTTKPWEQSFRAPYVDNTPWKNRLLPEILEEYPYLTISDFLADTVVRMPYGMNSKCYYDGGLVCKNEDEEYSYLLPLKSTFFQFFTVEELREKVVGTNKPMFEFVKNTAGVKVILRIPIQRGFIEYSRIYSAERPLKIDKDRNNDGGMIDTKIGMGIMPLVRFPKKVKKNYRIALFDKGKNDATLSFFDGTNDVDSMRVIRAQKELSGRGCSHEAYAVEDNFDRILVCVGDVKGFIVPIFKPANEEANGVFTFAVDLGTTNTHIEYCTDSDEAKAFDVEMEEMQICKLHKTYSDPDIRTAFEEDFIPDIIGDEKYSFPMRTAFAKRSGIILDNNPIPLADGNIPFIYEKKHVSDWNKIETELKWSGGEDRLLKLYIDSLFILMRNKVILNNGNLSATKVIWFYPASMDVGKINRFAKIWRNAYEKYFEDNSKSNDNGTTDDDNETKKKKNNVISISESKAPYLYFIGKGGAKDEIITIDIGGGTTDVFIVEQQQDKMLLSFRFASNAIFGDAYNSNPSKNGFVCKYKEPLRKVLESNKLLELQLALKQIEKHGKSTDIINFLFSLVGEKVNNNSELDLLDKLSNDGRMRYVFIIFYGSILYFIAKTMKAKGIMKPKTIAFSGNGARTLHVLSEEDDMVAKFAKLIFDGVYGDKHGTIEVKMKSNPKIATCKGGIEKPEPQDYEEISEIKTVFVGNDFEMGETKHTYADITDQIKSEVVNSVKEFFKFLFELHKNNNEFFVKSFAAESTIYKKVVDFCTGEEGEQTLKDSIGKGIKNKLEKDGIDDETPLEETLFFYPLVGLLHDLAYYIYELK